MTRWLLIGIVLVLVVVGVHDVGLHFAALSDLNSATGVVTEWAGGNAHATPERQFATALAQQASANGTTITQYALEQNQVRLWAEGSVNGSWVVGPYLALTRGVPFSQAMKASYVVRTEKSAIYSR